MKAIILLSGGVDSTVSLAIALDKGRKCLGLSFDYGQKHKKELESACEIAQFYNIATIRLNITPAAFRGSSLTDLPNVPKHRSMTEIESHIPSTYVPARNLIFLSFAAAQAETFEAEEIYFGANKQDQAPYPDCRPEFFQSFQDMLTIATKQGTHKRAPHIITPLITMTKKEIIETGRRLKAPLEKTFSCYDPSKDGMPCLACDACLLRLEGFQEARLT